MSSRRDSPTCEGGRVATHEAPPPARRAGEGKKSSAKEIPRPEHCRGVCGGRTRPPDFSAGLVLGGMTLFLREHSKGAAGESPVDGDGVPVARNGELADDRDELRRLVLDREPP